MTESLTDLPPNILIEILSRLPLKTLFACRCTCKTFCNLISHHNPFFIAAHSLNASQIVMLQFDYYRDLQRLLGLIEPEFDLPPGFKDNCSRNIMFGSSAHHSIYGEISMFCLVNSCNGLLYCVRKDDIRKVSIVCNPVTSEYFMIPEIDLERSKRTLSMWLGFCPLSNKYKVLRFSTSPDHSDLDAKVHVVGSNSWIDVQGVFGWFNCRWEVPTVVLDGFIYWLDDCSRGAIVYFDFEEEKFGVISLPDEFDELKLYDEALDVELLVFDICIMMLHSTTIGLLDGSLCLCYNDHSAVHVWVRKRDGNQETWRKQYVVYYVVALGRRLRPLQVLRNGEILMLWRNHHLVCSDPMNHCIRTVLITRRHGPFLIGSVVTLKPSFIPLKDSLMVDDGIVKHLR